MLMMMVMLMMLVILMVMIMLCKDSTNQAAPVVVEVEIVCTMVMRVVMVIGMFGDLEIVTDCTTEEYELKMSLRQRIKQFWIFDVKTIDGFDDQNKKIYDMISDHMRGSYSVPL